MNLTNSDITTDALLLLQIQEGNSDAFNILYKKYWEEVYGNVYKRIKDADQSKDIVQNIFINIWLNKETHIDNLPAYLSVAVRNQVFKLAHKQKKMSPFLDILEEIPADYLYTDEHVRWEEFNTAYEILLNALPPKRQSIFRLRFQEDLTTKAIADLLGISRKSVQNQLGIAVEQLRGPLTSLLTLIIILLQVNI